MTGFRILTVSLWAGLLLTPAVAQIGSAPPPLRQNPRVKPASHPGEEILGKLSQMTPEDLEKSLASLPPARREQIEKRIRNFQQLPPAAQKRTLDRLARLNSLPPLRQNEVRRSMTEFNQLPQERKKQLNQEMRRMSAMPEEARRDYAASEEFRNRYSTAEQRMMSDLSELLPPKL